MTSFPPSSLDEKWRLVSAAFVIALLIEELVTDLLVIGAKWDEGADSDS